MEKDRRVLMACITRAFTVNVIPNTQTTINAMQKITRISTFLPHSLTFNEKDEKQTMTYFTVELGKSIENMTYYLCLLRHIKSATDDTDFREFLKPFGYTFKEYGKKKTVYNIQGLYITVEET